MECMQIIHSICCISIIAFSYFVYFVHSDLIAMHCTIYYSEISSFIRNRKHCLLRPSRRTKELSLNKKYYNLELYPLDVFLIVFTSENGQNTSNNYDRNIFAGSNFMWLFKWPGTGKINFMCVNYLRHFIFF